MGRRKFIGIAVLAFVVGCISAVGANAQVQSAGGSTTGFANVYGALSGKASAAQGALYNKVKKQERKAEKRSGTPKKTGRSTAAAKRISRPPSGAKNSAASDRSTIADTRPAGEFLPDDSLDTGAALAEGLGTSADEKALIRSIYDATKAEYGKEAAVRGWENNIAGGLTFFTAAAVMVYHDTEEPSDGALNTYFNDINSAIGDIPEFAALSDRDKQGFNDMLIGFGGIVLATYSQAKQNGDEASLASSRQLAGMLIQMVLATDPENIQVENGQIIFK